MSKIGEILLVEDGWRLRMLTERHGVYQQDGFLSLLLNLQECVAYPVMT